ncbi:MAG TPA: hypothetical protein VFD32_12390 [Dehalococcoidia bacterium]|nr:hypothetical protein [Dehalococcoidia bacterium]
MADGHGSTDWIDLNVQRHWYKLRDELDSEIQSATAETRRDYGVTVRLNTATIVDDGGRSVLRLPVSATWLQNVEQTIANLIITSTDENEPRMSAIAHHIAELLERWVEREVPVGASPDFFYPESEARWPAPPAPPPAAKPAAARAAPPAEKPAAEAPPAEPAAETAAKAPATSE